MTIPRAFALMALFSFAAPAQKAPNVEDAKRAIDKRLQTIWKAIGTKGTRTVLFQGVQAGRQRDDGSYPFRVSMLVHDNTEGFARTRYWGKTCVSHFEEETYTLKVDDFGAWDAQGRMTADLSHQDCKDNPADGVSSFPLTNLQGARAGAAPTGAQNNFVPAATAPSGGGGSGLALGPYKCWAHGQARMLLNFTMLAGNQYRDSAGNVGTVNLTGNRVTFRGGLLDGFMPAGFYATYGNSRVSFKNAEGIEVQACER